MPEVEARWGTYSGESGARTVASAAEALALMAEVAARPDAGRVLIGFTSRAGHFFAIGIGAEHSCACYWESEDPPYFQSRGEHPMSETIDFAYDGQFTEMPGTVRIDLADAKDALGEFMATGVRPKCIAWDET